MSALRRVANAIDLYRREGFGALIVALTHRYMPAIPLSARFTWKAATRYEMRFWDDWFKTRGSQWPDDYRRRLDPDLPLQPIAAALLPPQPAVDILDVGAGPLTVLGKKCEGVNIRITAIDPLADAYDRLLEKYHVQPPVRTRMLDAEDLSRGFQADTFDLVHARNSVDHAYNPEEAILQMIRVVKAGCYVLLEHSVNEAEQRDYSGMHQWNFSVSGEGDFLVRSKSREVNMTRKYADLCTISCEVLDGSMLITRILKRRPLETGRGM